MSTSTALVRTLYRLCLLVVIGWVLAAVLVYLAQRQLLYWPQPRALPTQTLALATDAGAVMVSVQSPAHEQAVIYLGGNAEDVSQTAAMLAEQLPGRAIYLLHYRGYGGSAGSPSETALVGDARLLFDQLASRYRQIDVIGRSLGSGIAVQLAASRPVQRLVLITPYDSMRHVAQTHYPWLPVGWLLKDAYDSLTFAPAVRAKSLLLLAGQDQIIPAGSGELLASRLGGEAKVITLAAAGHDDIVGEPEYLAALQRFFTEIGTGSAPVMLAGGVANGL